MHNHAQRLCAPIGEKVLATSDHFYLIDGGMTLNCRLLHRNRSTTKIPGYSGVSIK